MGAYIQTVDCQAALKENFGSLYALPQDQPDLDGDIAAAESRVNSYVGKRYKLPVTDPAAIADLKALVLDLFCERAFGRAAGDELPKKVATRADNARKALTDIGKGVGTIGGAAALAEQTPGGAEAIVVDGNPPQFTRDQMQGY